MHHLATAAVCLLTQLKPVRTDFTSLSSGPRIAPSVTDRSVGICWGLRTWLSLHKHEDTSSSPSYPCKNQAWQHVSVSPGFGEETGEYQGSLANQISWTSMLRSSERSRPTQVHACIPTHACTLTHTCTCKHAQANTHRHDYTHKQANTHIHRHTCIYTHTHMHMYTSKSTHTGMHTHIYSQANTYTQAHMHAYSHTRHFLNELHLRLLNHRGQVGELALLLCVYVSSLG